MSKESSLDTIQKLIEEKAMVQARKEVTEFDALVAGWLEEHGCASGDRKDISVHSKKPHAVMTTILALTESTEGFDQMYENFGSHLLRIRFKAITEQMTKDILKKVEVLP